MAWVVVDDPLPAATALGRAGGDSAIATQGEQKQGTVWPAFEERTFTAYPRVLPLRAEGTFVTEYTVPSTTPARSRCRRRASRRVAPEMFGEVPVAGRGVQPCDAAPRALTRRSRSPVQLACATAARR